MEPQQTPIEPNFSTNVTNQSKLAEVIAPLHRVTRVSKILAAVVMIVLPFAGFWVGYTFKFDTVLEIEQPLNSSFDQFNNIPPHEFQADIYEPATDIEFPVNISPPQTGIDFAVGELGLGKIAYVTSEKDIELYYREYFLQMKEFTFLKVLDSVHIEDEKAYNISKIPFLYLLATTSDSYIFSAPSFNEDGSGISGLYKYSLETNLLSTMKTSDYFYPDYTGEYVSPAATKIAVTKGFTLGVIDLATDTFNNLKTFKAAENKTFSFCERLCDTNIKWLDTVTLKAQVYEYESCDKNASCWSSIAESNGNMQKITLPVSTSTLQFTI